MAANGHATKERVLPPAPLLPSIFTCGKTNSSSDAILPVLLLLLLDNSRFGVIITIKVQAADPEANVTRLHIQPK